MFKKRAVTGLSTSSSLTDATPPAVSPIDPPKAHTVQGRPSLGANVFGRGIDVVVGGTTTVVKGVAGGTTHVVKGVAGGTNKAVKRVLRDPLARVARTAKKGGSKVDHLRRKIFPPLRFHLHGSRTARGRDQKDATSTLTSTAVTRSLYKRASEKWSPKQSSVMDRLLHELRRNFLFSGLESSQLHTLIQAFEKVTYQPDDVIIQQGDHGDYFYILYQGSVVYEMDGEIVGSISTEDHEGNLESYETDGLGKTPLSFGELALFFDTPRAASVICTSPDTILFRLDQVNFRLVVQHEGQEQDKQRAQLLKQIPVLQNLDDASINKLVSAMTQLEYVKDELLFQKGDIMTDFFIVWKGCVQATDVVWGGAKYQDLMIGPNQSQQYFGWKAMVENEPLIANVQAVANGTTVLAIEGDTFRRVVGRHDEILQRMERSRQLQAIAIFRDSQLEESQVLALLDFMQPETYHRRRTIIYENATIDAALYFVRKGQVHLESTGEKFEKSFDEGGYFGQDWMLVDQNTEVNDDVTPKVISNAKVTVEPHTEIDVLSLEDVRKVLDTSLLGLGKPVKVTGIDPKIHVEHLQRHIMLGSGSFGQVWLASYQHGKGSNAQSTIKRTRVFALKVQSKHQLLHSGQAQGVVAEVNIMKSLKSPFIIRLYSTFQDTQRVYMLTSLLQGGELESVMGDKAMADSVASFYAAGILEGLTYMHRRHVVHRDIKPENILIDSKGYPVIIDLGFAKYVPDKTYTFCGTPMYIAPEVIQYKGHDKGADHWSWACIVFEMISAKYPFYENGMPELDLFKKIIRGQFKIYGFMSLAAKMLLIQLLVPDPDLRLGAKPNGWQDLFALDFFKDIDFKLLRRQALEAPWVPALKDPLDASNFESTVRHNWPDKMKSDDPPLSDEEQAMFHAFGKMSNIVDSPNTDVGH